jgi:hypothetical protein
MASSSPKRLKTLSLFHGVYLPAPLVSHVIDYLDVASLVQVAGCNSSWHREVYDERPNLWTEIEWIDTKRGLSGPDFEDRVRKSPASNMTDSQLAALLKRCKARERCHVLKLTGCLRIQGTGLEPLRGSHVLREIDLRLCGSLRGAVTANEIVASAVFPILESMPPFVESSPARAIGLSSVKLDRSSETRPYFEKFDPTIATWIQGFRSCVAKRAQETPVLVCKACAYDVAERADTENLPSLVHRCYCEICKNITCGDVQTRCCMIMECEDCALRCCQPIYGDTKIQNDAHNHKVITPCTACNYQSCEDCSDWVCCTSPGCIEEGDVYCKKNGCNLFGCVPCECQCTGKDGEVILFCRTCIPDHNRVCPLKQPKQVSN